MKLYKRALCLILGFMLLPIGGGVPLCVSANEAIHPYGGLSAREIVNSYVDDKINISDEVFYGKYDEASGQWIHPGYFDYEKYPELSSIQEAAQEGNYPAAKEAALEYWRRRYDGYLQPRLSSPSTSDRLLVKIMENNVQMNVNSNYGLYGILKFGKKASYQDINMLEFMNTIISRPDKQVTFYLMGLKKDGTSVSIESKDAGAGHRPYMEITSKGVTYTIEPEDDATISPAENRNTNYGSSGELLVEESISSINAPTMADKNTKRSLVKFDLSFLDESTAPTRAILKLYGSNIGEGDGEVIAFGWPSNAWSEESVLWYSGDNGEPMEHGIFSNYGLPSFSFIDSNPSTYALDFGTQFCNYRYGEELLRFSWAGRYNSVYMSDQARNEDVAYDFLRHWIGYLNQRGNTPRFAKALDGSVRDNSVPKAMQWYIDSDAMSPDLWSATLKYMWLEIDKNIATADSNNNWRTYQSKGLSTLLSLYTEFRNFDAGLAHLQWLVETNAAWMLNEDGSSIEAATNYAATAINDLLDMDTSFTYAGMNDVTALNPDTLERVRRSARYVFDIVMPGARNPMWGDSGGYRSTHLSMLENVGSKLDLPELLYVGTNGNSGTPPKNPSKAIRYLEKGTHVMRTGWNLEKDLYLLTDVDGGTGSHTHSDDLAVILHAYGQYLLTDQAFYSYASNTLDLRKTEYHNTVLFQNRDQARSTSIGDSHRFETNAAYDNFTLTTKAYSDVTHTRNFLFIKPYYFIINDYLVPTNKETNYNYKQHWCMLPTANPTMDTNSFVGKSNFADTANIQVAQANFDDMITPTVVDSFFSQGNNTLYNSKKLRFEKNAEGTTLFNTVLYPEKRGEKADVFAQPLSLKNVRENGVTAMSIHIDSKEKYADAEYYLVHDSTQQQLRSFGTSRTDGHSAYVERGRDERIAATFLQDATVLEDTARGITLFKSEEPVAEFAATFSAHQVIIQSPEDVDLTKLTLYADNPTKVTDVYVNGTSAKFKLAGRYIYFGANPILSGGSFDSKAPPPSNEKPSDPHANKAGGVNNTVTPVTPPVTPPPSIPQSYLSEIEGHWGSEELMEIVKEGILQGIDERTLNLDGDTTRAAFTTMLLRALDIKPLEYQGAFDDVSAEDWFAGYVQAAKEVGLTDGVGDGFFAPYETVTREQAAKLLMSAYMRLSGGEFPADEVDPFADDKDISDWALPSIRMAREIGIMQGDELGAFMPKRGLTRAEAAITSYRLSKLLLGDDAT